MATPNPIARTNSQFASDMLPSVYLIAGIQVNVYGVDKLPQANPNVACLWLHHPRVSSMETMEPTASHILKQWQACAHSQALGLIAVAFDQRNHGTRQLDKVFNEAWRGGNERHAQDMFGAINGMMLDTRQLIEFLPAYIFPSNERRIVEHLALGVSLGGHSVWQSLLFEPRVSVGIVVIGMPDYAALMYDRARLSKRKTWTQGHGSRFFGSADFPVALMDAMRKWDPTGFFIGGPAERMPDLATVADPQDEEQRRALAARLTRHLGGKRIQCLSGGSDKLVPSHLAKPFMQWLKRALGTDGLAQATKLPESSPAPSDSASLRTAAHGWAGPTNILLEDLTFADTGHEFSPPMLREATRFVLSALQDMAAAHNAGNGARAGPRI